MTGRETNKCRCICPNGCYCGCECPAAVELRTEQRARAAANGGPIRIQRRRTFGWRAPQHAVYVGRPTRFGNPFRVTLDPDTKGWHVVARNGFGVGTFPTDLDARRYATDGYRFWINEPEQAPLLALVRPLLHGRDLTCWCPLAADGQPDHCHAAVLLEIANRRQPAAPVVPAP